MGPGRVLQAADTRLTEIRRHVPDAGGLVIASDQDSARAYGRLLARVSGERPSVVVSEEPRSSRRIAGFAADRWLRGGGVTVARGGTHGLRRSGRTALAVGVYATSMSTPLHFAQAVGRFVRLRRRGEIASVFLPTVPSLLSYAGEMEVERDHVLDRAAAAEDEDAAALEDSLMAAAQCEEPRFPDADGEFTALGSHASSAGVALRRRRVRYGGGRRVRRVARPAAGRRRPGQAQRKLRPRIDLLGAWAAGGLGP